MKKYTYTSDSWVSALADFRNEIRDLKMNSSQKEEAMRLFLAAYRRSEDYDMSALSALNRFIPASSRKSMFKSILSKTKFKDL